MVTRKQERALRSEIAALEHKVENYKYLGRERDDAIKLLREWAEKMPDLSEKAKLLLALADLTDSFAEPVVDGQTVTGS